MASSGEGEGLCTRAFPAGMHVWRCDCLLLGRAWEGKLHLFSFLGMLNCFLRVCTVPVDKSPLRCTCG